jgi:hypothetical protein
LFIGLFVYSKRELSGRRDLNPGLSAWETVSNKRQKAKGSRGGFLSPITARERQDKAATKAQRKTWQVKSGINRKFRL